MKLVIMSDLHGHLPKEVPVCDVVCICGDISPLPIQRYSRDMLKWLSTEFANWVDALPCKKVVLVPGNHDFIYERHADLMDNEPENKLQVLCDEGIEIEGKLFYGTPWCPDLYNWAFYGDHVNLVDRFSDIPEGVDVLITHCPPRIDTLGTVLQKEAFNYGANYGCQELADAIEEKQPMYCFSGHVHSGNHNLVIHNKTILSNASIKDETYNIHYKPLEITI